MLGKRERKKLYLFLKIYNSDTPDQNDFNTILRMRFRKNFIHKNHLHHLYIIEKMSAHEKSHFQTKVCNDNTRLNLRTINIYVQQNIYNMGFFSFRTFSLPICLLFIKSLSCSCSTPHYNINVARYHRRELDLILMCRKCSLIRKFVDTLKKL